jgi:hypothetical protein
VVAAHHFGHVTNRPARSVRRRIHTVYVSSIQNSNDNTVPPPPTNTQRAEQLRVGVRTASGNRATQQRVHLLAHRRFVTQAAAIVLPLDCFFAAAATVNVPFLHP